MDGSDETGSGELEVRDGGCLAGLDKVLIEAFPDTVLPFED